MDDAPRRIADQDGMDGPASPSARPWLRKREQHSASSPTGALHRFGATLRERIKRPVIVRDDPRRIGRCYGDASRLASLRTRP